MSDSLLFVVPGEPMSKARARVVNGHAYTPKVTRDAEGRVRDAFVAEADGHRRVGPLSVSVHFYAGTKVRRDLDNMLKLVLDALNKLAWDDDCQIQRLLATRTYVGKGEGHTNVSITELNT